MPQPNPHFFHRQSDGSVRIRIRFTPEEADVIEEAAGSTPLLTYIHQTINTSARIDANDRRKKRQKELDSNRKIV